MFAGRNLVAIGEMPGTSPELGVIYTDPDNHEVDMLFTFEHVELDQEPGGSKWNLKPLALPDLKGNLNRWQSALDEVGWNSLYFENHDQPRVVSRWGDDSREHRVTCAKTLGTVLHLHKGTPFIYQGEELGMTNAGFESIEDYVDLESINAFHEAIRLGVPAETMLYSLAVKSRDNARTPMQWNGSANAGFTEGTPWLAVNPNYQEINAAAQVGDPDSVFSHYQRLIRLRHSDETVQRGSYALLEPEHLSLYAFTRTLDDDVILVLANLASVPCLIPESLPDASAAELILGTHPVLDSNQLAPWESRVLRLA